MRYRPSALALLLLFLAFRSPPLDAQTRGTEGYVDAGGGVRLFYPLVGTGRDTLVIIHGGPGLSFVLRSGRLTSAGAAQVARTPSLGHANCEAMERREWMPSFIKIFSA